MKLTIDFPPFTKREGSTPSVFIFLFFKEKIDLPIKRTSFFRRKLRLKYLAIFSVRSMLSAFLDFFLKIFYFSSLSHTTRNFFFVLFQPTFSVALSKLLCVALLVFAAAEAPDVLQIDAIDRTQRVRVLLGRYEIAPDAVRGHSIPKT